MPSGHPGRRAAGPELLHDRAPGRAVNAQPALRCTEPLLSCRRADRSPGSADNQGGRGDSPYSAIPVDGRRRRLVVQRLAEQQPGPIAPH